ncbi:MAG: rhomboid family intramembrane serine protease, partial [Planctomycetes bacterium]|nr:rhomboid family intramembrane serine protease [Planctomycetota bacterium]
MKRQGYKSSRELNYSGRWVRSFALILGLNLVLFGLQQLLAVHAAEASGKDLVYYLGLDATRVLRHGWVWQLITHLFLHNFLPLVLCAGIFWLVAADLEARWGAPKVLAAYVACGGCGGAMACLAAVSGPPAPVIGSVGAVMGLLGIHGMRFPDRYFFGMVRSRWFFWTMVGFHAFWYLVAENGRIVAVAQMCGGICGGLLFLWAEPFVARRFQFWERRRRRAAKHRLIRVRAAVDVLLERIHREGFDALSRRERAFLRQASRLYQQQLSDAAAAAAERRGPP